MPCPREKRETAEALFIGPHGLLSTQSTGRPAPEPPCEMRTCFQRDVDRITHSKSFRRLKHKTQVFLRPEGDHYRTRLTHTLEVARLARTIARALELNEDLTEAISLGHDLGHTPFGHAGERALNAIYTGSGFRHYEQSLRVVDRIERDGRGLNLCNETRIGILNHTTGQPRGTLEADVVRLADRVAYINHDLDDAMRGGIVQPEDVPAIVRERVGSLDIFGHESTVDLDKRIVVFDIHGLGEQLKPTGLLVITDTILNRVTLNWKKGKRTHIFIDEFHVVFENEQSGIFFNSAWRQFRKRNGYPTAITQNVEYLLDSVQASTMLSNSEFVVMLNQAFSDRAKLSKLLNISDEQMSYVTNADAGCGLIKYGSALVPFTNRFPKDTELYRLMTTRPGEGVFGSGNAS